MPYLRPGRLERGAGDPSIVALSGNRVYAFDPLSGTHAELGTFPHNWIPTGPAVPPPPRYPRPEQAAVDAAGRALYLVSAKRVLRFDLDSGALQVGDNFLLLRGNGSLDGVLLRLGVGNAQFAHDLHFHRQPAAAAFDAARNLVLVADADWGGILAVDARTGATVLLAR